MSTKRLDDVLVGFVDMHHQDFDVVDTPFNLPGHLKCIICLHTSNIMRIIKQEMCNNVTEDGRKVKSLLKNAFKSSVNLIRQRHSMNKVGRESLYYISDWLLRAAIKAAKQRENCVRDKLFVLVVNLLLARELVIDNRNLSMAKVEKVELL